MKRQLTIAVMIVIAVLTISSVGVVSAASTSVQTQQQASLLQLKPPAYYTVNVGKNALWTGLQYNYRQTSGVIDPTIGTHRERSVIDVITTNLTWSKPSGNYETSIAAVGVQLRLAGTITPQQWQTLSKTPVIIRIYVPYSLQTTNGGATRLTVRLPTCPGCAPHLIPIASVQNGAKVGVGTVNARVTLGDIVREAYHGSGVYTGVIQVVLQSYALASTTTTASGSASGAAAVSYTSLVWPAAA